MNPISLIRFSFIAPFHIFVNAVWVHMDAPDNYVYFPSGEGEVNWETYPDNHSEITEFYEVKLATIIHEGQIVDMVEKPRGVVGAYHRFLPDGTSVTSQTPICAIKRRTDHGLYFWNIAGGQYQLVVTGECKFTKVINDLDIEQGGSPGYLETPHGKQFPIISPITGTFETGVDPGTILQPDESYDIYIRPLEELSSLQDNDVHSDSNDMEGALEEHFDPRANGINNNSASVKSSSEEHLNSQDGEVNDIISVELSSEECSDS